MTPALNGGDGALKPHLGLVSMCLLGIGASVGSGIFFITGIAARDAGPAVVLAFALAAGACLLNGLCFAELSGRYPVSGGAYVYVRAALGEIPATICAANLLADYHVGAAVGSRSFAVYAVAAVKAMLPAGFRVPAVLAAWPVAGVLSLSVLAPTLNVVASAVLCCGVQHSARLNNCLCALKLGIVAIVIAAGAGLVRPTNWLPFAPCGPAPVAEATALVFFAFTGFDCIAFAAEEALRPQRDVPIGICVCILTCAVLYVAVSALLTGATRYDRIDVSAPMAQLFAGRASATWVAPLVDAGAAIGIATGGLVGLYAQARLYLSMARTDGGRAWWSRWLMQVRGAAATPVHAQLWCGAVAVVLSGALEVSALASLLSAGVVLSYLLTAVSLLLLRAHGLVSGGRSNEMHGTLVAAVASTAAASGLPRAGVWPLPCILIGGSAALGAAIALCSRHLYDDAPAGVFACPLVPLLPVAAVVINTAVLCQLPAAALARVVVIAAVVTAAYRRSELTTSLRCACMRVTGALASTIPTRQRLRSWQPRPELTHSLLDGGENVLAASPPLAGTEAPTAAARAAGSLAADS